jgi:hypothetical protein
MEKTINKDGLITIINDYSGHSFAGLKTLTVPKLNKFYRFSDEEKAEFVAKGQKAPKISFEEKTGLNPENILKESEFVCELGFDYEQGIKNRLIAEGKDVSAYEKDASWHVPYGESKVLRQHKDTGEVYFYAFVSYANNPAKSRYIDISNDSEVSKKILEAFLPPESDAPKNQGLSEGNEVEVRTLKLSSVKSLSAFGDVYKIEE